jgi:hypothetical protein
MNTLISMMTSQKLQWLIVDTVITAQHIGFYLLVTICSLAFLYLIHTAFNPLGRIKLLAGRILKF